MCYVITKSALVWSNSQQTAGFDVSRSCELVLKLASWHRYETSFLDACVIHGSARCDAEWIDGVVYFVDQCHDEEHDFMASHVPLRAPGRLHLFHDD